MIEDFQEARKLYQLSAEQGYPPAQFDLGWLYAEGDEYIRDLEKAVYWMQQAAVNGIEDAVDWLKENDFGLPEFGDEL